jgi:hypothetical protein
MASSFTMWLACVYLGFSTWHDADQAAKEAQGLLVTALA